MGYEFVEQHLYKTGYLKAMCGMKFDRGVLAVGYGAVSDIDCWRNFIAEMFQQSSGSEFDMCPREEC